MKNIFDLSKNGAKKIYIDGTLHPIKVGMREISLQNGKKVCVYDTTGAYTDDNYQIDIRKGMPKVREPWIKEREKEGEFHTQLWYARHGIITPKWYGKRLPKDAPYCRPITGIRKRNR